jgi:hypothetical protein
MQPKKLVLLALGVLALLSASGCSTVAAVIGCHAMSCHVDECVAGDKRGCDELETGCIEESKAKVCRALAKISRDRGDYDKANTYMRYACFARADSNWHYETVDRAACAQVGIEPPKEEVPTYEETTRRMAVLQEMSQSLSSRQPEQAQTSRSQSCTTSALPLKDAFGHVVYRTDCN